MIKKLLITLFIVSILVISGCGEQKIEEGTITVEKEKQDDVEISEQVIEKEQPEEKDDEPDETEQLLNERITEELKEENKALPSEVRELMEKSTSTTKYTYYFDADQYFVMDDKIHIIYSKNKGDIMDDSIYNNLLLDTTDEKAYVWCTDKTYCGPGKPKVYWEVDYEENKVITPVQRLQALTNAEIINADTSCEGRRRCMEIEYKDAADGIDKTMWIFTYNSITWKVFWEDKSKGKEFTDLYQNMAIKVKDEDVTIPEEYELAQKE